MESRKVCSACRKEKLIGDFTRKQSMCKLCVAERQSLRNAASRVGATRCGESWTTADDRYLLDNPNSPDVEIAKALKRTIEAIVRRRNFYLETTKKRLKKLVKGVTGWYRKADPAISRVTVDVRKGMLVVWCNPMCENEEIRKAFCEAGHEEWVYGKWLSNWEALPV